jgi:uncharacterized protein YndB with AHSA1/START domain
MSGETDPIVVTETFDVPAETLWRAITERDQMVQWFFEPIPAFEPRVGFETEFVVSVDGRDFPHLWKIVEVVAEQRIVYEWRYGGYPGSSTVTWQLDKAEDGTRLTVTHSGHETFPRDIPEFQREAGLAGWRYFLQESLKGYLS